MKLVVGDRVKKVGEKDVFTGIVVAIFTALSGVELLVVENEFGVLHIYAEKLLRRIEDEFPCLSIQSKEEKFLVVAALRSALVSIEKHTPEEVALLQKALRRVDV